MKVRNPEQYARRSLAVLEALCGTQPITANGLMDKCAAEGVYFPSSAFYRHLRALEESGHIAVRRRIQPRTFAITETGRRRVAAHREEAPAA